MEKYMAKLINRFIFLFAILLIANYSWAQVEPEQKKIVIKISGANPPFEFVDLNGNPKGFNVDIIDAVLKKAGLQYELQTYENRDSAIGELQNGKIDMLSAMTSAAERTSEYLFCMSFGDQNCWIISRKNDGYNSLRSIKGKEIIVIKNTWTEHFVEGNDLSDNTIVAGSWQQGLRWLSEGKYDCIIADKLLLKNMGKLGKFDNLVGHATRSGVNIYSLAVLSENAALYSIINEGILELKASGSYERIYNYWIGHLSTYSTTKFYWIISLLILLLLFVGIVTLFLQRRVKEAVAAVRDTDVQLRLQARENDFVLQALPVGLEVYSADGTLLLANNMVKKMFGWKNTISIPALSIYENPLFLYKYKQAFREGKSYYFEATCDFGKLKTSKYIDSTLDDSVVKIIAYEATPLLGIDGKVEKYIQIVRDVTESRMRINLIDSMKKSLKLALEVGNISVWGYNVEKDQLYDIQGNIFIYGPMSLNECLTLVHPEDLELFSSALLDVLKGKNTRGSTCIRFRNLSTNEYEYIQKDFSAVLDEEGKVKELIGTHHNVTGRIQDMEKREKLMIALRLAVKSAKLNVGYLDVVDHEFYNLEGEEFVSSPTYMDLFVSGLHPEDRPVFKNLLHALLANEKKSANVVFRIKNTQTETYTYLECGFVNEYDTHGKLIRIAGTKRDVSSEKEYQERLEDGRKKFALALAAGNISVWSYDEKDKIFALIHGNAMVGGSISLTRLLSIMHPDDRAMYLETIGSIIDGTKESADNIFRCVSKKRQERILYFECQMMPQYENGKIVGIIGTRRDVTEEYLHQQALEESKTKTELAIRASGIVQWEYDCYSDIFIVPNDFLLDGQDGQSISPDFYTGELVHLDDRPEISRIIVDMKNKVDEDINFNVRMKRKDENEWHHLIVTGMPMKDSKGAIIKYSGFRRDVSDWVKINEEVNEKNIQLNLAMHAGHIIPFVWDINKDLFYITSSELKEESDVFRDEKKGLNSSRMLSFLHPDDRERAMRVLLDIKTGVQEQIHGEARYNPQMGYENYFEINILAIKQDKDTFPIRAVGYMQDITERKHLLKDLENARIQAVESSTLKSAFLANMSHEIRTPLNAIVGFSELLKDTDDEMEKETFWNIISTNNELLLRLIGDILDLSKIESGMMEFKNERFDIAELYLELSTSLKQRINNPDIKFICDRPYESCFIVLDKNRVTQIITNFVTNAIKYTPSGFIRMGYIYENGGIKIEVQDSGIGVAESKRYRVFHRFEKLDDFAQGTGLGLSICKAIAEMNGGNVGFDSIESKGSTFWAWIPCTAEISELKDLLGGRTQVKLDQEKVYLDRSLNILVAEDIDSNYMLVRSILKEINLTRAINGSEAVDLAHANKYDVILMDMRMPVMDGLTATRKIRVFDSLTPIIAVTANAFDTDRIEAIKAGCNDFVAKPLKRKTLLDAIKKCL